MYIQLYRLSANATTHARLKDRQYSLIRANWINGMQIETPRTTSVFHIISLYWLVLDIERCFPRFGPSLFSSIWSLLFKDLGFHFYYMLVYREGNDENKFALFYFVYCIPRKRLGHLLLVRS